MFAVLKTGGKQYRVAPGDTLRVEKLAAEAGEVVQFNEVLMVDGEVGTPLLAGAAVQATVIDQVKADKVIHFVRRRRKHSSKRTKGHRQSLTLVRVTEIMASGGDATGVKAAVGARADAPAPVTPADARRAALRAAAATADSGAVARVTGAARTAARGARRAAGPVAAAVEGVAEGAASLVQSVVGGVADAAASILSAAVEGAKSDRQADKPKE